jgi:hypothetical protein
MSSYETGDIHVESEGTKELQRVSVISACIKGDMACARAAGLQCLSVRQIKRSKKRMRADGEAALAHANRGRPSHRRLLPCGVRQDRATRARHLRRLQRSPPLREARRTRELLAQPRNDWLEGRGPRLTALGMQDDATSKILVA